MVLHGVSHQLDQMGGARGVLRYMSLIPKQGFPRLWQDKSAAGSPDGSVDPSQILRRDEEENPDGAER